MQLAEINTKNVDSFNAIRATLVQDIEKLSAMTKRHPIECDFGDLRIVFSNRQEIEHLIAQLRTEILTVRAAA